MPVNSNALIRYKTIDKCLCNHYRKWTLDDLIEACSEALYEFEGIDRGVSKRTVQADIQMMRSNKLGYNAPIVVREKKYYCYEDKEYTITNIPLTDQDLEQLSEAVQFLKQFQGFTHFAELGAMVQKLESEVYAQKQRKTPVIDFETNRDLKGLNWLDTLYKAIINKQVLDISYQSFKARTPNTVEFHPLLLKEFNNRWFVLGVKTKSEQILNFALDRIQGIEKNAKAKYRSPKSFDAESHFQDVIGVTVNNERTTRVVLRFNRENAPYVLTKPLHHSQLLLERDARGAVIQIKVKLNFELERRILGYGMHVEVLKPERLRKRIGRHVKMMSSKYDDSES